MKFLNDLAFINEIHVRGLSTKVDFTQVAYSMPEAVLDVRGNRFRASNVPVFDPEGNRGSDFVGVCCFWERIQGNR